MLQLPAWFVGAGIALIIELYLIWRLARALFRGTINIDLKFWATWYGGMDVTADRATNPAMYWLGTSTVGLLAVVIAVIAVPLVLDRAGL